MFSGRAVIIRHIQRHIGTLSADSADHNQRGIRKRFRVFQQFLTVSGNRGFNFGIANGELSPTVLYQAGITQSLIKFRQFLIDRESRVFQSLKKRDIAALIRRAGPVSAIDGVNRGPAKYVEILRRIQRQGAAFVFQEYNSLRLHFLDHGEGYRLCRADRGLIRVHAGKELRNNVGIHGTRDVGSDNDCQQQGHENQSQLTGLPVHPRSSLSFSA